MLMYFFTVAELLYLYIFGCGWAAVLIYFLAVAEML